MPPQTGSAGKAPIFCTQPSSQVRASLMITCLGDALFPQVGRAAVEVLRRLGVIVDFPPGQTCCG